jgi:two-component system LytT family response regulator
VPDVITTDRPLRVAIVDDEPLARDGLRLALRRVPDVTVVAECEDGVSAVDAIQAVQPDLVFLDVQMPGLDGFEVIDRVGVERMPAVVFVTAFDVHAIRAFEVHAVDYVLKPFEDKRLRAALQHARSRQEGELGKQLAQVVRAWNAGVPNTPTAAADSDLDGETAGTADRVLTLHHAPEGAPRDATSFIARFTVREDGRIRFVQATDVDYIEADGNYIIMHVGDARHRVRASLRDVSRQLDPKVFMRVHRSTIVNIHRIREVQPWFGGDYIAILRNGVKLKVSRQRAPQLLRPMA